MNEANGKVELLKTHDYSSNRYLLYTDESDSAIVIDPGLDANVTLNALSSLNKRLGAILLTHAHYDHIACVSKLKNETGAAVYLAEKDMPLLESGGHLAWYFGRTLEPFIVDNRLICGVFDICGYQIEVIPTPGHTHGGLTFVLANKMFTGDALFFETYGRTDLPGSDESELIDSAKRLFAKEGDFTLYCGHGKESLLSYEREHNPIKNLF